MFLGALLEKFKESAAARASFQAAVQEVIFKHTGGELKPAAINFTAGRLKLRAHPTLRLTILLKKDPILKELNNLPPHYRFKNIYWF